MSQQNNQDPSQQNNQDNPNNLPFPHVPPLPILRLRPLGPLGPGPYIVVNGGVVNGGGPRPPQVAVRGRARAAGPLSRQSRPPRRQDADAPAAPAAPAAPVAAAPPAPAVVPAPAHTRTRNPLRVDLLRLTMPERVERARQWTQAFNMIQARPRYIIDAIHPLYRVEGGVDQTPLYSVQFRGGLILEGTWPGIMSVLHSRMVEATDRYFQEEADAQNAAAAAAGAPAAGAAEAGPPNGH